MWLKQLQLLTQRHACVLHALAILVSMLLTGLAVMQDIVRQPHTSNTRAHDASTALFDSTKRSWHAVRSAHEACNPPVLMQDQLHGNTGTVMLTIRASAGKTLT